MKVIAIYARKSLFTGKGDSIGAQIDTCKKFIEYKFANTKHEIKIFKDEGFSGKTIDRPAFSNMMKFVKNKGIDYVITYKLDRLGRTARDLHNLLYELDKIGIVYLSATEPYDTTTSAGRFMISILAAMAQMERERLAERVKGGMIQLAKKGRWLGGQTPLGFDSKKEIYIDETGKERQIVRLSPNRKEIKIVKFIYNKYLEFGSMTKVRKYCLENSIRGKNGGEFSINTLNKILSSPIYVKSSSKILKYLENQGINVFGNPNGKGIITFNKTKEIRIKRNKSEWIAAVGKHKGIIEDTDWLQVQNQLKEQSKKKSKKISRQGTSSGLLSGILRCAKCGSNMIIKTGHKSRKNLGETYRYYVCNKKINTYGKECNNTNIRVDEADKVVIKEMKLYNKQILIENLNNILKESIKPYCNNIINNIDILKSSIQDKKNAISNLIEKLSFTKDKIVSSIILNKISDLNKEIKELDLKLKKEIIKTNEIKKDEVDIEFYVNSIKNFNDNIEIIKDTNQKKILLKYLLSSIEWDGKYLNLNPIIK